MTDKDIQLVEDWAESFKDQTETKEDEDLPELEEFYMNLACPKWEEIKETVERAANAFAYDGFDPLYTARAIFKMAAGDKRKVAALVVLALEVGSLTSGPKVISKEAAEQLCSSFGILRSAAGNSRGISLPRVVLSLPGYAFQILRSRKVSPKVTIPDWPHELSFPGSINALRVEVQDILLEAYNMWSVTFGLTISQGTKTNRNKKVVEELNKVMSGEPVSDLTWSETMQFTKVACKVNLLKGSDKYKFCNHLTPYAEKLARCVVAAKKRCIVHPSVNLPSEEVQQVKEKLLGILPEEFNQGPSSP